MARKRKFNNISNKNHVKVNIKSTVKTNENSVECNVLSDISAEQREKTVEHN